VDWIEVVWCLLVYVMCKCWWIVLLLYFEYWMMLMVWYVLLLLLVESMVQADDGGFDLECLFVEVDEMWILVEYFVGFMSVGDLDLVCCLFVCLVVMWWFMCVVNVYGCVDVVIVYDVGMELVEIEEMF